MSRVKRGVTAHARHKKVLLRSSGFRGRSSTCYRPALERLEKSMQFAYRDRRNRPLARMELNILNSFTDSKKRTSTWTENFCLSWRLMIRRHSRKLLTKLSQYWLSNLFRL